MNTYRRLLAFLTIVIILGMTACGGGSTIGGNTTPTPIPTPSVATSGTAMGVCPASSGLPANTNVHGSAVASGSQLSIEASDFFFSPTCVMGVPSGAITLVVHNSGVVLHNVSIPSLKIDMDVASGQTIMAKVKMGNAPLVYFCKYHRGAGMLGALLPPGSGS